MKYARYLPELNRRETWAEIVRRNKLMHLRRFEDNNIASEIEAAYQYVEEKRVLPSMRSMQFAGRPIELNPVRMFNCAYGPVDDISMFSEIMFLLLSGTGVGYSVQQHHISKLPFINKPNRSKKYIRHLVDDSIVGWSNAIRFLIRQYFIGGLTPEFDFSDIRPKGTPLKTSGGKAPGPGPLRTCLSKIQSVLENKQTGSKLSSLECHDIICHIADAVLSGGIRRAALISLFSADDQEMLSCKSGNWWELNPQRGRANNSAVLLRYRVDKPFFDSLWDKIKESGSGEPGIYFSNDKDWGVNPCCEIALRPHQLCNLVEINGDAINTREDFVQAAQAAATIATLQASYTNFHYLRPIWREQCEKDALLGVSITGLASCKISQAWYQAALDEIVATNHKIAERIGISSAARMTCVKPAGTTSLVLGTSSGIHPWHNDYYLRRVRVNKTDAVYAYLSAVHPELLEDDVVNGSHTAVISFPQRAPNGAILRNEPVADLLERIKNVYYHWVVPGHLRGANTHNVSATVPIKNTEWDTVGEWLWANRDVYNGISVFPYDDHTYVQAPFEDISEEEFNRRIGSLTAIDTSKIVEFEDNSVLQQTVACGGGACELP
jgi:ribonucleoside-diphosphate reductase alpha chain